MSSENDTEQILPRTHILGLPVELKTDILGHLDSYYDLKRCLRVCKGFKEILEGKTFDVALFRIKGPVDAAPPEDAKIILHPIVEEGDWCSMVLFESFPEPDYDNIDSAPNTGQPDGFDEEDNNFDFEDIANSENATSPPVSKLYVETGPKHTIHNKNGDPISVKQLYQVVEEGWNRKLPAKYRTEEFVTYFNALSDRNGWRNWDTITRKKKDGCIVLAPAGFDS